MRKRSLAILLLITIFTSMLILPKYVEAEEDNRTLGEKIAEEVFKVDESNEMIFTIKDREMLVELIRLMDSLSEPDDFSEAYAKAFDRILDGQQDRMESLGAGVNTAKGFVNFIENNIYDFSLEKMETYLMEDDKKSFAKAIDEREEEFRNEMEKSEADLDNIDKSLEGLKKLFKLLRKSKTFHTEFFSYYQNSDSLKLNRERAKEVIDDINEDLENKIENIETVIDAMEVMPEYYNDSENKSDKNSVLNYLKKYGITIIITGENSNTQPTQPVIITPSPTPSETSTSTATTTSAPSVSPTSSGITIIPEEIPEGSVGIPADLVLDGNKVSGSLNVESWNEIKDEITDDSLFISTKSEEKNIKSSDFSLHGNIYNEILYNTKIETLLLSTDNGTIKIKKDIFEDSLGDFLKNDSEEVKSTATIKFEFNGNTIDSQMYDSLSQEQKKLFKKDNKYFDINIYLSKINQSGEFVTKKLNSGNSFKKEIEISLPYELKSGESPEFVTVFYLGDNGVLKNMQGIYNESEKVVLFKVKHLSIYVPMVYAKIFNDVISTYWAKDYIYKLVSKGIIQGVSDYKFAPSKNLTRAEFATLLLRLLNEEDMDITSVKNKFLDINKNDWYYKNILIASELGLIKGYNDNTFKPNQNVTREELAVMILRVTGNSVSNKTFDSLTYEDKGDISEYAKEAVAKIYGAEIMVGKTGNKFDPKGKAKRDEASKVVSILFDLLRN
ncbi:MAG: S-layer homology domain-containing protein [Clostridiales bacterium]